MGVDLLTMAILDVPFIDSSMPPNLVDAILVRFFASSVLGFKGLGVFLPRDGKFALPLRDHLDWVRDLSCVMSRKPGPCDPAHISAGNLVGRGLKVGDNHIVPLNHFEHMRQHQVGERTFLGDDQERVQQLAIDLYDVSGDTAAAERLIDRFWRGASR